MRLLDEARRMQLRRRVVGNLLALQLIGTVIELAGIFTLLPVFQYIQGDGDVAALVVAHDEWRMLTEGYALVGLSVSLATLLATSFTFLLLRQAVVYIRTIYQARVREGTVARVRALAFERFLHVSGAYQDRNTTGGIVNDLTTELGRSADYLFGRLYFAGLLVVIAAYGISLLFVSIGMTAVAIVLFGSALLILRSQMHKSEMVGRDVLSANAEAAVFLVERLKIGRLIRLSGMEVAETAEMQRLTERQRASLVHLYRLMALVTVVLEPIVIGASFVFIYLSVTLFGTGIEQIGIFLALILRLLPVVKELANTRQATRSTGPAFEVVVKRLESMAREREPENGGLEFAGLARSITFEQVSFAYEGNDASPALRAFSAVLEKGKLYALVGPSGAGKSTLTDMIPRLRWPDSGRILIDDTPLEDFDLASLRASIAYAPQTPQLFNVSIAEHIRYGKPNATMEDIHRAAEMAGVAGFVADLANGYETEIGEAGLRLSGGQRQRLDLARALVRQAPILILDEPTSNLDAESEVRLRDAMQRIRTKTETTMIVIAHRLATVAMADKILVLDRGLLVTEGPHDELMSADGWYASAFSAQQAVSGRETDERETANA
ncbi:MAG: ABC transporter ATP-binding protein [Alphaproteobacteria bacterium]|nr:ABC transporter ATP-binding protein [Alphaproteobacteria bacterium]